MKNPILFVIGSLDVGGAEGHLVLVLPRLLQLGYSPVVFTLLGKGSLAPNLERIGIRVQAPNFPFWVHVLPSFLRKPLMLLIAGASLCHEFQTFKPKIAHFFLPHAYLIGGAISLLYSSCLRVMSRRSLNKYQSRHRFVALVERVLHKKMHALVGNSQAVFDELLVEGVSVDRLHLIYNGIDTSFFCKSDQDHYFRSQLGIASDVLVITCVANLMPYKGHADLLHALAGIERRLASKWVLLLVGRDGGIQADLELLAKDLNIFDHIYWLGSRSDVSRIYSVSDIGVLCSHEEGFSNSVLEGLSCEIAMVVTNVGGNAEAVLDRQCGLVVPPKSPDSLAAAIWQLADNPAQRCQFASAGRARVIAHFAIDRCAAEYDALYRKVINGVVINGHGGA